MAQDLFITFAIAAVSWCLMTSWVNSIPITDRPNHENDTCREPNTTELTSMLALAVAQNPTLAENARALFPGLLGSSAEAILGSYDYNFTTHLHPMSKCPRHFLNSMDPAQEVRSLCPWRYVLHSDINRYPRDIIFVQCECQECVDPELGVFSSNRDLCRPVIHNHPVLRRTGECINGVQRYEEQFEPVPMACVCERFASRMSIN